MNHVLTQQTTKKSKSDQPLTEYQQGLVEKAYGLIRLEIRRAEHRGIRTDDESESDAVWAAIQASRRFDPALGWKWSSYVTPWIRQAIFKGANSGVRFLSEKPARRLIKNSGLQRLLGTVEDESPERKEDRDMAYRAIQVAFSQLDADELAVAKLLMEGLGRRGVSKRLGIGPSAGRYWTEIVRNRLASIFGLPEPCFRNGAGGKLVPTRKGKRSKPISVYQSKAKALRN